MKALTFFSSNYKGKADTGVDVVALKESMDQQQQQIQQSHQQQQPQYSRELPDLTFSPAVERVSIVMANTTVATPDSTTAGPVIIVSSSNVGRS